MKRTLPIKSTFFFFVINLLLSFTTFAQEIEVTGKVTDENGKPLYGVNILVKGMWTGTISDSQGDFTVTAALGSTLVFSHIGYKTVTVLINADKIEVKLEAGPTELPEVIITEFYNNRIRQPPPKGNFVENDHLYAGNIYHPYQIIRGKVPGLTISKPGGDPLGTYDVYQRGQHSLYNTDPLVVVDGLPGASLQTIDIQDIESITVLRDAAMVSLYGTRGANGVVEITSKKHYWGKKLKITYSGYASIEKVAKTPNVLDANQFRSIVNNPNSLFYNPSADFGASTDWAKEITRTGVSQAHNLAFQGNLKNTHYHLSLNYRDVNGVAKGSGFNQSNALLNVSQDLFKKKVQLTANTAITHRNFTEINKDVFYQAAIYNPTAPVRTDTSSFGGYFQQALFDYQNPVALLEQIDNQGKQTIFTTNLSARWNIIDNLRAEVQYGFQQQDYLRQYRTAEDAYVSRLNYQSTLDLSNQSFQTSLNYQRYFDKHEFNLTGGYQYQKWTNLLYNADEYDLAVNNLYFANINFFAQADSLAIAYKTNTKLAAFFGRLQYGFDNWLFVNANWRLEGASRFGDNNKWGNFYGVGASVNVAELLKFSFTDYLRARVSYGVAGKLPPDGIYSSLTLHPSGHTFYNGNFINIYTPATNANPDLKWEERREWNAGVDGYFFNTRLYTSIDFYWAKSKDLVGDYQVSVPPNLAYTTYANFIDFENRGVEIGLGVQNIRIGDLKWDASINFAADRPKFAGAFTAEGLEIKEIAKPAYVGVPGSCCAQPIHLEAGKPLGRFVGREFVRFENGQPIFKDQNKDDQIDLEDEVEIGNALPKYTFGFLNEFRWNQMELSFFLRGVMGHHIVNTHAMIFGFSGSLPRYNVLQTAVEGKQSQVVNPPGFSSYVIENASFATLENLVVAYNFNLRKRYLSTLKVYAAAQNLFTLSNYSGIDPEVRFKNRAGNSYRANTLVPGLDTRVGYYSTRTFTLGVQAAF